MNKNQIMAQAEKLMAHVKEKSVLHDADIENNRIKIHIMISELEGSLFEKLVFVFSLAEDLSNSLPERNEMYRRFIETVLDGPDKAIKEIKERY